MKIIYYSNPYFADCDFPLIKELRGQGHQIIYILLFTKDSLKSTLIDINTPYPQNGIFKPDIYKELNIYKDFIGYNDTYIINNVIPKKSIFEKIKFAHKVIKFINSFKADYIWTTRPFQKEEWPLYFFNKVALTIHDPFPHSGENLSKEKSLNKKIALNFSKKIFILNERLKNDFCVKFKVSPLKVYTNKLGRYDCIKLFHNDQITINKKPYILFYGRISPYKGIEYLIESFLKINKLHPELNLIIAGSGKLYFDFSPYKNIKSIELRNYYINMDETAILFNNAEFIVCPYTDATQSGVIMTAFTLNKTVVASNVGAINETVIDHQTGLLVRPQNIEDLSNNISLLYTNKKLRSTIEENIKNIYSKGENSWENITKQYIDSLKK